MLKKKKLALLISAYSMAILLIAGCASVRGPAYTGRTIFIPLKSSPEGAMVTLDGSLQGLTPVTLRISYISAPRGSHDDETRQRILKIEKEGYKPFVLSFSIKGGEYKKIPDTITLKKADDIVKRGAAPDKDHEEIRELKKEIHKYSKALEEIEKLKTEMALFKKEKNRTQQGKKDSKTAPDNRDVYQKIYTIQTGSFIKAAYAQKQFDSLAQKLNKKELDYLRIEKVGRFYCVRLGKFKDYGAAGKFIKAIKPRIPGAIILKAYMKPGRIIRSLKYPASP